jgi:hypothetical protein
MNPEEIVIGQLFGKLRFGVRQLATAFSVDAGLLALQTAGYWAVHSRSTSLGAASCA